MMAAESVSQALARIETIRVVPSPAVLAASTERSSQSRDRVQTLAAATSSGLVVTGSYYLQGHAPRSGPPSRIAIADKPLYPIPPAEGPREKPMEVVETVEQNVLDTLAARYLNPFLRSLGRGVAPPRFEAQREFPHRVSVSSSRDFHPRPITPIGRLISIPGSSGRTS